jgi:hypothetical protein
MRRREFITIVGSAAASWPFAARAQQDNRVRRIGWLVGLSEQDPEAQNRNAVVVQALRDLGWILGRNLHIDYRYTPATRALQQATSTIPIVFALVLDPVASGVVTNLVQPGGNVTGFTNFEVSMGGKWVEFLKEVSPRTTKLALIFNPRTRRRNRALCPSRTEMRRSNSRASTRVQLFRLTRYEARLISTRCPRARRSTISDPCHPNWDTSFAPHEK